MGNNDKKIKKEKKKKSNTNKKKKKMGKGEDSLKTPQSPQQQSIASSKIINLPSYPSTNPLPFNLPQISFSATNSPSRLHAQSVIANPMQQYEHLSVSQPVTASYPSQQINYNQAWYSQQQQAPSMPVYATQTIHGYQYHHAMPAQATAYYAATPSVLKSNLQKNGQFASMIPNFDISKASPYCDT